MVSSSSLLSESAYCCCVDSGTALGLLPSVVCICFNLGVGEKFAPPMKSVKSMMLKRVKSERSDPVDP